MIETLNDLDKSIFIFLNSTIANPITDFAMPIITSDMLLRICYGIAVILLLWKGDARLRWLVLFSAVALLLSDQAASKLLKPMFERIRPCHVLENINLLVNCGAGYSMPSSHAANAFAQGALFSLVVKKTKWYLWVIAGLIAISRVFVGVHYPFDVLVGSVIGIIIGIVLTLLFIKIIDKNVLVKRELGEE
jgi:undecaprenyl-diphosphatase